MQHYFVTGISTDVGKTIASAIITEALQADYWKPIQAGELANTDSKIVGSLLSNSTTKIHPSSYELTSPMSPHAAAAIDGVTIETRNIVVPKTDNYLVIEGAGGILVPLNDFDTIFDIIMPNYKVIIVSKHYIGSINHTLLTVRWLQQKGYDVSIIFNGKENTATEKIILDKTEAKLIGRIDEEVVIDKKVIKKYAVQFKEALLAI